MRRDQVATLAIPKARTGRRRAGLVPGVLLPLLTLTACGGGGNPSAAASFSPGIVQLVNFQFAPRELRVVPGSAVTFVNEDSAAHTVTEGDEGVAAPDARFDDRLDEGRQVIITFAAAGIYHLTCKFHPTMSMTVTVGP